MMGPWLLIIVVAMAVVLWRLIGVAGVICQQRARVAAHSARWTRRRPAAPYFSSGFPTGPPCWSCRDRLPGNRRQEPR